MPGKRGDAVPLRTKEATMTLKLFDTIELAAKQIEVDTKQYGSPVNPAIQGVELPEEIKGFTLPGASPMAQELARERIGQTRPPEKPFSGLARWYKDRNEPKYSEAEWKHARDFISNSAVSRRAAATGARERTASARAGAKLHLSKTSNLVRNSLTDREVQIKLLAKKLEQSKKFADVEAALMEGALESITQFTNNRFEWPLSTNKACQKLRDGRIGIDYVTDDVDVMLQREFAMLSSVSDDLVAARAEAETVMLELSQLSQVLHDNVKRKKSAAHTEHQLSKLSLEAAQLRLNLKMLDPESQVNMVNNDDWLETTGAQCDATAQKVAESRKLRQMMSEMQYDVEENVRRYESDANNALRKRLTQYEEAQAEDEQILLQCRYEVNVLEAEIATLHKTIDLQTQPIKRNTTRLKKRYDQRPAQERTMDSVNTLLVQEAAEISAAVRALKDELEVNEQNLIELRKMESMLEEDIEIKKRSIRIERKCIYRRSYFAKFKAEELAKNHQPNPR